MNYSGSLLWLGRLQYTLEPDTASLGCHIPEAGPLTPELVDASLELARQVALPAYSDFEITGFTCTSWLLDAGLSERLPATSNVARFAARFEPYGEPGDGRRDALFFGFHRETRDGGEVDLDSLPQDSRRTVLEEGEFRRCHHHFLRQLRRGFGHLFGHAAHGLGQHTLHRQAGTLGVHMSLALYGSGYFRFFEEVKALHARCLWAVSGANGGLGGIEIDKVLNNEPLLLWVECLYCRCRTPAR